MPVLTREVVTNIEGDAWIAQGKHADRLATEIALSSLKCHVSPDDRANVRMLSRIADSAQSCLVVDFEDVAHGTLEIPTELQDDQVEDWFVSRVIKWQQQVYLKRHEDG